MQYYISSMLKLSKIVQFMTFPQTSKFLFITYTFMTPYFH